MPLIRKKLSRKRLLLISATVIAALILSNYFVQQNYQRLDAQVRSIYQDRLMPSHYLFQIQSLLLRKKFMQEHGELQAESRRQEIRNMDASIDSIIRAYEQTYLTAEEEKEWKALRQALQQYDSSEEELMGDLAENRSAASTQQIETSFQDALLWLSRLNTLQTEEGSLIRQSSQKLIHSALLQSYVQISLVIILLAVGIALILSFPAREDRRSMYN
jgi:hypothetical protein